MYKLSKLAAEDFAAIYEYTLIHHGAEQADSYTSKLEKTFNLLAISPFIGNEQADIAKGVRRLNQQKHAIFYRQREHDIFIIRILHQHMDAWVQLLDF